MRSFFPDPKGHSIISLSSNLTASTIDSKDRQAASPLNDEKIGVSVKNILIRISHHLSQFPAVLAAGKKDQFSLINQLLIEAQTMLNSIFNKKSISYVMQQSEVYSLLGDLWQYKDDIGVRRFYYEKALSTAKTFLEFCHITERQQANDYVKLMADQCQSFIEQHSCAPRRIR